MLADIQLELLNFRDGLGLGLWYPYRMAIHKPGGGVLTTAEHEWLIVGILRSIIEQGRLTPETAQLPGIQRALAVVAREAGKEES